MYNTQGYNKGKISIIIPAVKNDPNLYLVIESIIRSTYQHYQLIIVCEGLERSKQRNIGISKAEGEFLLFLDSDQIISKTLLEECIFAMNFADALYIPERICTSGWFGKFRDWERQFYTGTAVDCVKFVRNKDVPLYDESMSGPEDSDWDRRIKGQRAVTTSCLYHYDEIGLWRYLQKKAYYSKSMSRYSQLHPRDKVLNPIYRCVFIFIEHGKWKKLFHPYVFILIALLFVRGVIYLWKKK